MAVTQGPLSQENWKAALRLEPPRAAMEWPLVSDARLTGQVEGALGPYAFLNLVPFQHGFGLARAALVLRIDMYLAPDVVPDMSKTDQERYHGGTFADELASLASLVLGVRIKASGASRVFDGANNTRGTPIAWEHRPEPALRVGAFGQVVPGAAGERALKQLEALSTLPLVRPADAVAFVRAARLYQEALWVAESEPSLSWLLLAASVESAANQWQRKKAPSVERLSSEKPALVSYLQSLSVDGLVERIAREFSDSLGSTKKFTDFLITHLPPAPSERSKPGQLSWQRADLEAAFRIVYGHRSRALHDGIPFPAPMCAPAWSHDGNLSEMPMGLASSELGGVWRIEDTPMMLHMFDYIARGAILSWWRSLDTHHG